MSIYDEMMATAIETKHRQLCLARKGLFRTISSSMAIRVNSETTRKEIEDQANAALDEIIRASVAVDQLQKEFDEMQRSADKITHEVNASKSFFEWLFKDVNNKNKKDL